MRRNKLILALLCFMSGGVICAQNITFGAWGRAVITPFAGVGENSSVSAATSTWSDVPYISFSAAGAAPGGNIGFNIDFDFGYDFEYNGGEGKTNVVGDNAKAWVKPLGLVLPERFNMLKLTAGKFNEDDFRGKIGATEFSGWLLPSGGKDEDSIFQRFQGGAAAHIRLEPIKWLDTPWNGLIFEGAVGSSGKGQDMNGLRAIRNLFNNEDNKTVSEKDIRAIYDEDNKFYDGDRKMSAADVFRAGQYAIGYNIPDIGLARVQFIGGNLGVFRLESTGQDYNSLRDRYKYLMRGLNKGSSYMEADVMEAAFLFKMIKGLTVDVGAKIPFEYKTKANFTIFPAVYGVTESAITSNPKFDTSTGPSKENNEFTIQRPYNIALGVNWTPSFSNGFDFINNLNIMARVDFTFGEHISGNNGWDGDVDLVTGNNVNIWFVPSYRVVRHLTLGLDLGFEIRDEDTLKIDGEPDSKNRTVNTKHTDFGIGPWLELNVGGGKVRTGVAIMIPDSYRYVYNAAKSNDLYKYSYLFSNDPIISVPISITYSF